MGYQGTEHNSRGLIKGPSRQLRQDVSASDVYEIRPREDGCGFDLISDGLRRGPIWYSGPDAVRNAVAYAKYRSLSRSRRAIIRVLNHSEDVVEAL
jgi:hypothetical protein